MQESSILSRVCAVALLDAYCRDDAPQMGEIAVEAQLMSAYYAFDARESECLEVLGGIAGELLRAFPTTGAENLDTYIRLLMHLARPDLIESVFGNHN